MRWRFDWLVGCQEWYCVTFSCGTYCLILLLALYNLTYSLIFGIVPWSLKYSKKTWKKVSFVQKFPLLIFGRWLLISKTNILGKSISLAFYSLKGCTKNVRMPKDKSSCIHQPRTSETHPRVFCGFDVVVVIWYYGSLSCVTGL